MRIILILCSLFIFGCNGGSSSEAPHATEINASTQQTTVTEKEISSIHITYSLINGTSEPKISVQSTLQFTATAYFEDHSKRDISEQVQWISSDQRTGTVTNAGQFKGINAGTATIVAQLNGIESNAVNVTVTEAKIEHLQIAPKSGNANNLPEGVTLEMVVTGIFSDNTHQELQRDALQWSSSDGAVVRRIQPGIVKAINKGSAKITAQFNGITSNTVEVTVTDAVVNEIQITSKSGDLNIPAGFTQPITVSGLFSDNIKRELSASDVTWSTANPSVATVDSKGIVKGISEGSTTISAQYNGIEDNPIESEPLTVTITDATLAEITITSSVGDVHNVVKGNNLQLIATGVFSDSSERSISADVSWLSDDENVAIVNNSGSIHAVEVGRAVISVEINNIKTEFTVDIEDEPVSFHVAKLSPQYSLIDGYSKTIPSHNNQIIAKHQDVKLIYKGDDLDISVTNNQKYVQTEYGGHRFLLQQDSKNNVIGFAGYANVAQTSTYYNVSRYTTFFVGYSIHNAPASNGTYEGNILYTRVPEDNNPKIGNMSIHLDEKGPSCLINMGSVELKCEYDITSGVNFDNGQFMSRIVYSKDNSYYGVLEASFYGESGEFATGYIYNESPLKVDVFLLSRK
ncbi:Ig-like domain-containing protein [uncultured Photobacterium sp.]|uniref:Ig-like domain-containing protein n=1 Tax=uncultured Photobacterium sp. TaxID=173973 RepID=UPI00263380FE|nr:Ig-like domain-containing protein [uncultured Photobacterium sp.]